MAVIDDFIYEYTRLINNLKAINGGKGSGNFGHKGRKGQRGGSSKLYEKIQQLADDLRAGKYNPLKYIGITVKIDNIEPSEKDYVISEITSNMSDYEKEIGFATRRLYSKTDTKDYMYDLIYDKDGMHKITRYEVTDNDVFN